MKSAPLIDRLALQSPDSTKTTLRSWIKQGRVTVDGKAITQASYEVHELQEVKLLPKPKFTDKGEVKILYEDRFLVVVDKPAGLLTVKAAFEQEKTLFKYLKDSYGAKKVRVVHRLDQGTSGVIIFALEEKAYVDLKKMFEKHEIDRRYLAILEGALDEGKGTWESYLWEDDAYVIHSSPNEHEGKHAITHYTVLKKTKHYTLVECALETGRKNQIRVHAAEAGYPVTGDSKYRAKKDPLNRLALHAHSIEFLHPITKKKIHVDSPVPENFYNVFKGA